MNKVLIIEDNLPISNLYKNTLIPLGYEITTAADGQEGLEKAMNDPPDIILLDLVIPKINGLEVLRQLKADSKTQKIPVVVMTNLNGDEDEKAALGLGAIKFIVKSEFEPKRILGMVADILAGNGI